MDLSLNGTGGFFSVNADLTKEVYHWLGQLSSPPQYRSTHPAIRGVGTSHMKRNSVRFRGVSEL